MDVLPWWNRIPSILTYPFNLTGLIAILSMTAAGVLRSLGGISPYGIIAFLLGAGLIFAIIMLVIRHSARGSTEFPAVNAIEDPFDDVIWPGLKVTLLAIVLYAPAIYCAIQGIFGAASVHTSMMGKPSKGPPAMFRGGMPASGVNPTTGLPPGFTLGESTRPVPPGSGWSADEPIHSGMPLFENTEMRAELATKAAKAAAWLLAAVVAAIACSVLYPMCLIVLALSGSLRMALFPGTWFVILRQVPLGYLGLLFALAVGSSISVAATAPLRFVPVPILPWVAGIAIKMYFTLCGAHLLGWFVFQNRARLGIRDEPERREIPISEIKAGLAGAGGAQQYRAAGMVRVGTSPAAAPGELAPGEVGGGPPPGVGWGGPADAPGGDEIAGLHARFQSACAARDIAAVAQSAPLLLDAYWQAGNTIGPIDVYRALAAVSPETSLGPERQARIAKELEGAGDLQTAMTAWRTLALAHPDHPRAPTALWRCAEVCGKLNRPDWVASACQAILARYPMSEVAALAKARMKKLGAPPQSP